MIADAFSVMQDMLSGLLKTAETLKVKGLAEVSGDQPVAQTANPVPPILRLGVSCAPVLLLCPPLTGSDDEGIDYCDLRMSTWTCFPTFFTLEMLVWLWEVVDTKPY